jgi:hypothetical protein
MKHASLLALALCAALPSLALAKDPTPPRRDKEKAPVLDNKKAQELSRCMTKCQEPMKSCMGGCRGNQDCTMQCSDQFTDCIEKTCGDLLPKVTEQQ